MRSFVKIKSLRSGKITLSFTDICKSCLSLEFLTSQICLLTLFAKKTIAKISEFTVFKMVLFREIILRYESHRCLVSDRGRNFMSKIVKALVNLFEIRHSYTSSYHPMTNRLVELKNSYILHARYV